MKLVRILDESEIKLFSHNLEKLCGIRLPDDYFLANETYAVYDLGQMIGGFAIARGKAMRCFGIVGGDVSQTGLSVFDLCEANAVWIDNTVTSYAKSLFLWLSIRRKLLDTGCAGVLMPWISSNQGLTKFYEGFVDSVIFHGSPMGRVGHAVKLKVGFATRSSIRYKTLAKHLPRYIVRAVGSSRRRSISPVEAPTISEIPATIS